MEHSRRADWKNPDIKQDGGLCQDKHQKVVTVCLI